MRQPSKGSIIMLIAAPVIGGLLLWFVIFPLIENDGGLHDLFTWKSSPEMNYSEDGIMAGGGETGSGGGFDEIQSSSAATSSPNRSSRVSSADATTGNDGSSTVYNTVTSESANVASNNSVAASDNSKPDYGVNGGTNDDKAKAGIKNDAERIEAIVTAAQQMKGTGEKVKEMIKGKDDKSKASGGGGGLLLLPPDDPDPLDVPLDGGLSVLVAAALGYGVRKTGLLSSKKTAGDNPPVE